MAVPRRSAHMGHCRTQSDAVRATKKSSTPVASGTTAEKGAGDAPAFTAEKKARCDIKFVKWLVRKKDDELNEFIDEVNAGAAAKSTTTNGASSSYVKCGPRLSKVLRLQKMTFKKMTLK